MVGFIFKPKMAEVSSESKNPNSHHHATVAFFKNIQTQFSKFIRPQNSNPIPVSNQHNIAMSLEEIKDRFSRIPVYNLRQLSKVHSRLFIDTSEEKGLDLYFMGKPDCKHLESFLCRGVRNPTTELFITELPLAKVIEDYPVPEPGFVTGVQLVPEIPQVKNALKEIHKETSDFADKTFTGVPVFQSKYFNEMLDKDPFNHPPTAFFSKEDLEKSLDEVVESNRIMKKKCTIQVHALEDIIEEMKDCSTSSKWKHVVFMAPGQKIQKIKP